MVTRKNPQLKNNFSDHASLKNVTVTVEMIGPEQARAILDATDFKNRKVKPNTVTRYATMMRNKQWKLVPEPLVFDEKDNLFQGQHRLQAVIEANCIVPFMIVRGWSSDVFDSLDSGLKRTVADTLTIGSDHASFNSISAAARLLGSIAMNKEKPEMSPVTYAHKITKPEILEVARARMDDFLWADVWMNKLRTTNALAGVGPSATTASIVYILQNNEREIVSEFLVDLLNGRFEKKDPRLALARWSPVVRKNGISTNLVAIAVFTKAWNAVWEDKPLTMLRWAASEKYPVPVVAMKKGEDNGA